MTATSGDGALAAEPTPVESCPVPFEVIDLASIDEFRDWLDTVLGRRDERLLLDFADVEMVLAVGVQALLDAERALLATDRSLAIRRAAPIVRRVFEICGVADRWLV